MKYLIWGLLLLSLVGCASGSSKSVTPLAYDPSKTQADLAAAQKTIAALTTAQTKNTTDITTLKAQITALTTQLGTKANQSDVVALQGQVGQGSNFNDLKVRLSTVEAKANQDGVNLTGLQSSMKTNLSSFDNRLLALQQSYTGFATKTDLLMQSSRMEALEARLVIVEQRLGLR